MKTIKIADGVHRELKVFSAQNDENMIDFAGMAIMKALKDKGHKFTLPKKEKKK
jgi:hypothetical protein